jgi:hypothetical protein
VACGIMDRVEIAHDRGSWRALGTAKMNFGYHTFSGKSLLHGVNYRVNYIRHNSDIRKDVVSFVITVCSFGRAF